jgi:hypothetical protein
MKWKTAFSVDEYLRQKTYETLKTPSRINYTAFPFAVQHFFSRTVLQYSTEHIQQITIFSVALLNPENDGSRFPVRQKIWKISFILMAATLNNLSFYMIYHDL